MSRRKPVAPAITQITLGTIRHPSGDDGSAGSAGGGRDDAHTAPTGGATEGGGSRMNWKTYQQRSGAYRKNDLDSVDCLTLAALGIAGESGEVVDHIKKIVYHDHPIDYDALTKEIGDLMWYVAYLLDTLDIPLDDVLAANIEKLKARYPDGFSQERSRNRNEGSA